MKNSVPVEVVLGKENTENDQMIDCSFSRYFYVGSQPYVALKRNNEIILLKVVERKGKQFLLDIKSQHEFDSVLEVYQNEEKKNPPP